MKKIILALFTGSLLALVSCQKAEKEVPIPPLQPLKTDSTSLSLNGNTPHIDSFNIQFGEQWTLTVNPSTADWLKPGVTSGTGNAKVYVTALQNNMSGSIRTATLVITPNGDATKAVNITVTQRTYVLALWKNVFGGTNYDQFASGLPTADGGYIAAGSTLSNNGDISSNSGNQDLWVVKVDSKGVKQWQKTYGGSASDFARKIIATPDNGYLIVGSSNSNDGDVSGNHGAYDFWVVKIDAQGVKQWQKTYGGSKVDQAFSVVNSSDGGYVVGGVTESSDGDVTGMHGAADAWLIKIDANGNKQWQKAYGGSDVEIAEAVNTGADGGFMAVGSSNARTASGDVGISQGLQDLWIFKVDGNGNLLWQKSLGGADMDYARTVTTTSDGKYIIAGATHSNNGDVANNHGTRDIWSIKIDDNGNKLWAKTFGGTSEEDVYSIIATPGGGAIMTGYTFSNNGDVTTSRGRGDAWIFTIDGSGQLTNQKTFGGAADDYANETIVTPDGGYLFVGTSNSIDGDVVGQHGDFDAWMVKFKN